MPEEVEDPAEAAAAARAPAMAQPQAPSASGVLFSVPQPGPWYLEAPTPSPEPPEPLQPPPSAFTSGPAPPCRMFTLHWPIGARDSRPAPGLPAHHQTRSDPSGLGGGRRTTRRHLVLRPLGFPWGSRAKPLGLRRRGEGAAREAGGRNLGKKQSESEIIHYRERGRNLLEATLVGSHSNNSNKTAFPKALCLHCSVQHPRDLTVLLWATYLIEEDNSNHNWLEILFLFFKLMCCSGLGSPGSRPSDRVLCASALFRRLGEEALAEQRDVRKRREGGQGSEY